MTNRENKAQQNPDTTREQLHELAGQASEASRPLAAMGARNRAELLRAMAAALDARGEELVPLADKETALGTVRLQGELTRTTGQLRLFADYLDEGSYVDAILDRAQPGATPPRPDLRRMLHPIGPVAVYAASNFPFAFSVAGGDTASALAAGCPVLLKEHPGHPKVSDAVARTIEEVLRRAGAPSGSFATVRGWSVGGDLIQAPEVMAGAFTGSVQGGRALFDLAAARPDPIPFYGELGSLNPVVVTRRAASERPAEIAAGLVQSFTMSVGQFCTKPGLVLVPSGTDLVRHVVEAAQDAHGGRMLTPRIAEGFRDRLMSLRGVDGVEELVVPAGGVRGASETGDAGEPVVLGTDTATLVEHGDVLLEECFGPVTVLVWYDDDGQLLAAVRSLPGSLTATVHGTDDDARAPWPVADSLRERAGRLVWNGWPTGVAVTWAMHHGGPWPATTASQHTSVGMTAIRRFLRPLAYQDVPATLLPDALQDANPLGILRRVDGVATTESFRP